MCLCAALYVCRRGGGAMASTCPNGGPLLKSDLCIAICAHSNGKQEATKSSHTALSYGDGTSVGSQMHHDSSFCVCLCLDVYDTDSIIISSLMKVCCLVLYLLCGV